VGSQHNGYFRKRLVNHRLDRLTGVRFADPPPICAVHNSNSLVAKQRAASQSSEVKTRVDGRAALIESRDRAEVSIEMGRESLASCFEHFPVLPFPQRTRKEWDTPVYI
jgi:hypothetical protein